MFKLAMEQSDQPEYGLMHADAAHEYPDPDYAAYVTKYPWRGDDGYLPPALHGLPSESLENNSRPGNHGNTWKPGHNGGEIHESDAPGPAGDMTWDPDYQMSEAGVTYLSSSLETQEIGILTFI